MYRAFSSVQRLSLYRPLLVLSAVLGGGCLAAAQLAPAADRQERPIGPGVRLLQWSQAAGPQQLAALEVDAANPLIQLGVSYGDGQTLSLVPISRQAERYTRLERYAIAGVNGDFFFYPSRTSPGIPTSATVVDGEVIRTPFTRSCMVIHADRAPAIQLLKASARVTYPGGVTANLSGVNQPRAAGQLVLYTPRFGMTTRTPAEGKDGAEAFLEPESFPLRHGVSQRARVRSIQASGGNGAIPAQGWVLSGSGAAAAALRALQPNDSVEIRIDFDPALAATDQVLGGGPRIVRGGKVSVEEEGGTLGASFAAARHPRTAVGFNGRKVYLLVVDGRQPGYSAGMTLPELGQAMVDLGCTDAMNLDGGGSTTLWARGDVINRPSDGRERAVANGLLVFSTAPRGEAARLRFTPPAISALPGAEVSVKVNAEDANYNPVPVPGAVNWTVPESIGTVRSDTLALRAEAPANDLLAETVTAQSGAARGELPVRVYARPARVEVLAPASRLGTRTQAAFRVRALDPQGRVLALPASVRWSAAPEIGSINATGSLATGAQPARGAVTATIAGVSGTAQVEVAEAAARALADFENGAPWKLRVSPAGLPGAVTVADGTAHSGTHALKLAYDFSAGTGTRAVYALTDLPLGKPFALKAWVYGDGQGEWLRARVRDAKGETHFLDLARKVDWSGSWRELRAGISDDFPTPLTLEAIYVIETDAAKKPKGALLIDDVGTEG